MAEVLSMTRICRTPECENRKFANARSLTLELVPQRTPQYALVPVQRYPRMQKQRISRYGLLEKRENFQPRNTVVYNRR